MATPVSSSVISRRTWILIGRAAVFLLALLTLMPFWTAILWGAILALVGYPIYMRLYRLTGRGSAALLLSSALALLAIVVPGALFALILVDHAPELYDGARSLATEGLPPAPAALSDREGPIGGIARAWDAFARRGSTSMAEFSDELSTLTRWLMVESKLAGVFIMELILGVLLSLYLLAQHKPIVAAMQRLVGDALGERGLTYLRLAATTVRTLASSLVVGSFAQTITVGMALFAFRVPDAGLLCALTFVATMIQIGPLVVWVPVVVWMLFTGQVIAATLLTIWGLTVVNLVDNVLRSMMLSRSAELPFAVGLLSTIGGLIQFGILGLFIGPVAVGLAIQILKFRLFEMEAVEVADSQEPVEAPPA